MSAISKLRQHEIVPTPSQMAMGRDESGLTHGQAYIISMRSAANGTMFFNIQHGYRIYENVHTLGLHSFGLTNIDVKTFIEVMMKEEGEKTKKTTKKKKKKK
jgi:hypothetical protein